MAKYTFHFVRPKVHLVLGTAIFIGLASSARGDHEPNSSCANSKPHPKNCIIKGNISRNGRIYHVPGKSQWYSRTCINKPGERWFCSEEEARRAGWRAPLR